MRRPGTAIESKELMSQTIEWPAPVTAAAVTLMAIVGTQPASVISHHGTQSPHRVLVSRRSTTPRAVGVFHCPRILVLLAGWQVISPD
jgi:hypothetical protein